MGVVYPREMLSEVCAANVAVVTATVCRRVLPLVDDQTLVAGCIVEEEGSHRATSRIARSEVTVDEIGCGARCCGIACEA